MKRGDIFSNLTTNLSNLENLKIKSSFAPFYNNYSKKFNFLLQQILELNKMDYKSYNIYNEKMKKILAFKENIFVHNKNMSLDENYKINDNIFKNYINPKRKKNFIIDQKDKNQINFIRPKTSITKYNTDIKNSFTKSKLILAQDYFDISYIKNKKSKIYNTSSSNKNKLNNKVNKSTNTPKNLVNDFTDKMQEIKNKIVNIKLMKSNKPKMFIKRPIQTIGEKYLLYLPKRIKKDTKNKYNFFSFILTDDIFNNIKMNKNKGRNKNKSIIYNKNNNKKIFNNSLLKENIEKKWKIINAKETKSENNKNKLYEPIKLKVKLNSVLKNIQNKTIGSNYKTRNLKEEEEYFNIEKIKSHPF